MSSIVAIAWLAIGGFIGQAPCVGEQHSDGLALASADVIAPDRREQEGDGAWLVHASFFATVRVSDAVRRDRTTWDTGR